MYDIIMNLVLKQKNVSVLGREAARVPSVARSLSRDHDTIEAFNPQSRLQLNLDCIRWLKWMQMRLYFEGPFLFD